MTREEAIAWLRSMGRNAAPHDSAFGKTIAITIGEASMVSGIEVYPGAVHVYPAEEGKWCLPDFGRLEPEQSYDDLEAAIRAAHEYVGRREREHE